jgi:hypothetical protein
MNRSNSHEKLLQNMLELDALVAFYQKVKDEPVANQVGSHHSPYILLKSNLIFLVTCWEEYIKSLVDESFTFMLNHSSSVEIFPVSRSG